MVGCRCTTDAQLLLEASADPLLGAYSVIVLDRVDMRTLATDVLLGVTRHVRINLGTVNLTKLVFAALTCVRWPHTFFSGSPEM